MSTDEPVQYELELRQALPWLVLFQGFRLALDVRKLVLCGLGMLLVVAGGLVAEQLPFADELTPEARAARDAERWPWQNDLGYGLQHGGSALGELEAIRLSPTDGIIRIVSNWSVVLRPWTNIVEPGSRLFRVERSLGEVSVALLELVWRLLVWALVGGAVARMTVLQLARDQRLSTSRALRYSLGRMVDYLSPTMLPLLGVFALTLLSMLGGLFGRIPGVGPYLVASLFGLCLLLCVFMALALAGAAVGFPVMYAAVSVEGTDGFDALSRGINYVFERPWQYAWYWVVTMAYGSAAIFLVWLLSEVVVHLAIWSTAWGIGTTEFQPLLASFPTLYAPLQQRLEVPAVDTVSTAALILGGWLRFVALLVHGFVYSFFWSTIVIIYLLLRQSVDGHDLFDVVAEDVAEADDLLPLVGTAAMGFPLQEGKPTPPT